ncbi:phycobilisome rod-core linker polypeptide CpcG2 [Cylindrospermopsis raciborskii CENA303]|uniref:Phycobilisome rod-core linker polypeptide CpcG2 n=1 Tax=Cylindrospermopsis raciborskii CENA303 TaxID=1170769 RepID=A0A1X4G2W3_9CYAN|nr:phycobilisome rod-core linker polypeptide [Cylindrospermopsis raciborskii]EFA73723.1 Phycobilisome linker polypeptide [Raphidiopsis brookii D9]NLQ03803.1 phycobilisome rod-core linker polypeptide CpcG2 [Cylindrospermopsis raciborskii MVCC19]OHY33992.1 phycobilisome rod-core linker polypeptide CpcG2 [Cylindrospermopsis raciborskii MVCC14]OSO87567.1 phycobilisome rod-core linker polypeptide CpcG2 [Cylindrospermopsis raciborskii CENA303]OSO93800.1 phycobilisome rod-core linker polypeptide CpcG
MAIPLLEYKPSSQNQRVPGYEVPNEDTPRIYRIEDYAFTGEVEELIWAAYRQLFSEHVILKFYRQGNLESQLKNKAITVRDFVRGLAKSQAFDDLVIKTNSNYRLVEIALKRLLGRAPYNKEEEIAWSIKIATNGWDGFVDALVDSEEYQNSFGENIIPYQRRRYKDRPFNLVTPRYANYWRDKIEAGRYKPGSISDFMKMAASVSIRTVTYTPVNTANIAIPKTTRETVPTGIPVSISPSANFPVK